VWWLQQPKEAQDSVFGPQIIRIKLKGALGIFSERMTYFVERVWCHPTFDWIILENAYKAVGLEFPFHYRMPRDLRTIVDEAGVDVYGDYENDGIAHNALDDCKFQVKYTVDCLKKLRVK